ncbi:MAG: aspartate kinase [Chitinophagaceae bacterium]
MLTVEKIGGTSMSAYEEVFKNIIIYGRTPENLYNRVFVVSAYAGVTNWLLEDKKTGEPGVFHFLKEYKNFHSSLDAILIKLKEINKRHEPFGLNLGIANTFIEERIHDARLFLDNLANILASGYVSGENILQAAREILSSIGEAHSAFNFVNLIQSNNINATFVDLSGFHDHHSYTIDQRIAASFQNIEFDKTICVATGYTKGTEGIMREFDRGYSEVTFSKIAVALKPREVIIHKEYHLCSADPVIVGLENCVPVGFTNYDVADQLADVGMEAIHPKASKPLEINNINLRIKNTFEPSHPGTLITKDYICPHKRVDVITGTDKVIIIDVYDPLMVGTVGFDFKIMQVLKTFEISYTYKTTSANSISFVIWEKDLKAQLIASLEFAFQRVTVEKIAVVCLIGSNIDQPGLLANAAKSLANQGINIKSAGFALRKVNIQFIIAREDFKPAIKALNKTMFY